MKRLSDVRQGVFIRISLFAAVVKMLTGCLKGFKIPLTQVNVGSWLIQYANPAEAFNLLKSGQCTCNSLTIAIT